MTLQFLALSLCLAGSVIAAPASQNPTSSSLLDVVTTSAVVVTANSSPFTFKASQVPESEQYAGLEEDKTVITNDGKTSTVYRDGFVWVPQNTGGSVPAVPTEYFPGISSADDSTIVVTATTGSSPVIVTFSASQDRSLESITSKTTSDGTTVFPLGWLWVPVVPAGGAPLPPTLPTPPIDPTPPDSPEPTNDSPEPTDDPKETQEPDTTDQNSESSCESTETPVVTVVVSYPTNSYGDFETTEETKKPSAGSGSCVASATTTRTTANFTTQQVYTFTGTDIGVPVPSGGFPEVDDSVKDYLDGLFKSLGIDASDWAETTTTSASPAQASCADNTFNKAISGGLRFIDAFTPSFCSEWNSKPTNEVSKGYSLDDLESESNSKRDLAIQRRSPPPAPLTSDSDLYKNWTVSFDWKPDEVSERCQREDYCTDAFSSLMKRCTGYSGSEAYKSGGIKDDCGSFSYSLAGYPEPATPSASPDPTPSDVTCDMPTVQDGGSDNIPKLYPQSAYEAAVHQFCEGGTRLEAVPGEIDSGFNYFWLDTTHMDPQTGLPAYCIGSNINDGGQSSASKHCQHSGKGTGLMRSDSKIAARVAPSPVQDGCKPLKKYKLPEGKQCRDNFDHVVSSCMSSEEGGKVGVWKESTENGCWDWWMWGRTLT